MSSMSGSNRRMNQIFILLWSLMTVAANPLQLDGKSFLSIQRKDSGEGLPGGFQAGRPYDIKGTIWLIEAPVDANETHVQLPAPREPTDVHQPEYTRADFLKDNRVGREIPEKHNSKFDFDKEENHDVDLDHDDLHHQDKGAKRWKNPDISKAAHKRYRLLRKTMMSEVLRELNSKDWTLLKKKNGDQVQILKDGLTGQVYLMTGIVDLDPETLFHGLVDEPLSITEWNPAIKQIEILQHINNRTMVFHQVLNQNSGGLFKERDFVNLIFWRKSKGIFYQFYESVEFPDFPETTSFVRADNGPSGFILSPHHNPATNQVQTKYQWLMDVDFKFQWMFQRLLKGVIPGVMLEYLDNVRAKAESLKKEAHHLQQAAQTTGNVTHRHGRSA
ncbi:unnamed protein product [Notodromas monacha]|uniref:START domain-containing protein n=1 Tax=Notodromas monacha TaxID=399045 RepID=A0A7R9GF98_9CRUS|nr:unnamed protein product [Notodromas monacha]CAG0918906.1 unnamed protein product [Notodromas monacha]